MREYKTHTPYEEYLYRLARNVRIAQGINFGNLPEAKQALCESARDKEFDLFIAERDKHQEYKRLNFDEYIWHYRGYLKLQTDSNKLDESNIPGEELLFSITEEGDYKKLADLLKSNKLDGNERCLGLSLIHIAVIKNHTKILKLLLANSADPDSQAGYPNPYNILNGSTALHMAIRDDKRDIVKLLLDNDADPIIEDGEGTTPWDLANEAMHRLLRRNM